MNSPNPYLKSLFSHIEADGIRVKGWRESSSFEYFDIVHVHWPELLLGRKSGPRTKVKRARRLLYLRAMRRRGAKVVWTAHNLEPHDLQMTQDEWSIVFERFIRLTDGVVHLTGASIDLFNTAFPRFAELPTTVIPHTHYLDVVRPVGDDRSREALIRLLTLGRVRGYKNLVVAAHAVAALNDQGVMITVAGPCSDQALAGELLGLTAPNVRLHLKSVSEQEMEMLAADHDAVLITQQEFLNSGVLFLALSLGLPVLAPRTPVTAEIQGQFGVNWVRLYDQPLSAETLAPQLGAFSPDTLDLSELDPGRAARRHVDFYASLLAGEF